MRCTAVILGGAIALSAVPAAAQELSTESFAVNARAHAHALTTSYQRLRDFIVRRSTGPTSWTGDVPPATTGWSDAWTDRGVRARYCADPGEAGVLVVYMGPGRLMGVGNDHRAVQAAPRVYGRQRQRLHWLDGGRALGGDGRPTVDLPSCMAALVPSGRAALAGEVEDPWTVTRPRTVWERREVATCPAGMHRPAGLAAGDPARIERRTVTTQVNKKGDPVGTAVYGPWTLSVDLCASDYTVTETEQRPCTYTVEGQSVSGYEIWTQQKTVSASGSAGTWSMLFTTCQVGPIAQAPTPPGTPTPLPQPTITFPTWTETEAQPCPYCFQGTASRSRIHTDRHARFPWDSMPTVQTDVQITQWVTDNSQCTRIPDTVWTQVRTELRTLGCGSGFTGTYTQQRSVTDRYVQPCGGSVSVTPGVSSTAWVTVSNGCVAIPPPPPPPPSAPPPQQPDDPQDPGLPPEEDDNDDDGGDDDDGGEDDGGEDDGGYDDGGGHDGGDDGSGDGDGDGDDGNEGGLGDGEDAAVGGDGLGSETADPSDDGVGSMGDDGGDGGDGDGGGDD